MVEICIGREVEGDMDIQVPNSYCKVSRKHAIVKINDEKIFIHDLESSNGTYVNGRRVSTIRLNSNDDVLLGDRNKANAYSLDIIKIKQEYEKILLEQRIDFIEDFENLKAIYQSYLEEKSKLKQKFQRKSQMPRIIISVLLGLAILILYLTKSISDDMKGYIYPLMMIITAATGLSTFIGNKPDISDALIDIELKYQNKYVCPKCKKPLNLNMHWKKLENAKTCPHGCQAIFSK